MCLYSGHGFKSCPRQLSVFFTVCLRTMPCLVLPSFAYSCTRFDRVLRLYVCLLEVA